MSRAKPILFAGLTAVLVLGVVEAACFGLCVLQADRWSWFDPGAYTVDVATIENKLQAYFDPELGWKKHYATPFGERPREADYAAALMATFGDSYTHGDEVEHDETWQTYLARSLEADVYNFGNGAYGTGQALLRFRQDFPRVGTPLVALGLTTENINRVVNRYRKFYYRRTGIPLTKPRFRLAGGGLELEPNPIRTADELGRLADPAFIAELGRGDPWYNPRELPRRAFPYARILVHRGFWSEAVRGKLAGRTDDLDPRPGTDLWSDGPTRELMFALFDRFVAEAAPAGATPLLMVLPRRAQVAHRRGTGRSPEPVAAIVEFAVRRGYRVFDGVAALADEADSAATVRSFFDNHPSPEGNRALARRLLAWLAAEGLVEARGR